MYNCILLKLKNQLNVVLKKKKKKKKKRCVGISQPPKGVTSKPWTCFPCKNNKRKEFLQQEITFVFWFSYFCNFMKHLKIAWGRGKCCSFPWNFLHTESMPSKSLCSFWHFSKPGHRCLSHFYHKKNVYCSEEYFCQNR